MKVKLPDFVVVHVGLGVSVEDESAWTPPQGSTRWLMFYFSVSFPHVLDTDVVLGTSW
jgi:hypothetical protein